MPLQVLADDVSALDVLGLGQCINGWASIPVARSIDLAQQATESDDVRHLPLVNEASSNEMGLTDATSNSSTATGEFHNGKVPHTTSSNSPTGADSTAYENTTSKTLPVTGRYISSHTSKAFTATTTMTGNASSTMVTPSVAAPASISSSTVEPYSRDKLPGPGLCFRNRWEADAAIQALHRMHRVADVHLEDFAVCQEQRVSLLHSKCWAFWQGFKGRD